MKHFNSNPQESLKDKDIVFIDLKLDFAFKYVFGTRGHEDMLLKLVNAILPDLGATSVSLSEQEAKGLRRKARASVFDVTCTTSGGETVIIEMQYKRQDDFSDRMVFYSSFPIQSSLRRKGGKALSYKMLSIYLVGISDFILPEIKHNDDIINYYAITNRKDSESVFSDSIHYVTVELPKLNKSLTELKTPAEFLFYAIRNIGKMDKMPQEYKGSGLEKLFEICTFAAMSEKDQMEYIHELMAEVDHNSQIRTARNEGLETAARNLKALGVPDDTITKATGLSSEQLASL